MNWSLFELDNLLVLLLVPGSRSRDQANSVPMVLAMHPRQDLHNGFAPCRRSGLPPQSSIRVEFLCSHSSYPIFASRVPGCKFRRPRDSGCDRGRVCQKRG